MDPGQRLKHARERLNLRYRDVEEASLQISQRQSNDDFTIALSRLSDIENRGTVPSIYRLYSLCTIYRLDVTEVLEWYGVKMASQAADAAAIEIGRTHPIHFGASAYGEVLMPLSLDPGIDLRKTTFLSRMIQKWGKLPVALLGSLDLKHLRYAFVGSEDWSMYPLIRPESLLLVDETVKKVSASGWADEFERPIYFIEHRSGYFIGWCSTTDKQLFLLSHPASASPPQVFALAEIDIIGQIVGVAMHLAGSPRNST